MAIDPKLLRLNSSYSRAELGDIFGDEKIASSREGLYPDGDRVIFFVTLDKEDRDQTVSYEDYFADGLFYWESQSTQAPHHKNIREILSGEMEPLLLVREVAKIRSQTQPFIYAGRLEYLDHDQKSSKPVKVIFDPIDLTERVSDPLKRLIDWAPASHRQSSRMPKSVIAAAQSIKAIKSGGQGFQVDSENRLLIESYAMKAATNYYGRQGYTVEDVSRRNAWGSNPFDLLCTKAGRKDRHVEVKGTTTAGSKVLLTDNEVKEAQSDNCISDLFIVAEIEIQETPGGKVAARGDARLFQRWHPQDEDLEAKTYEYTVPKKWDKVKL